MSGVSQCVLQVLRYSFVVSLCSFSVMAYGVSFFNSFFLPIVVSASYFLLFQCFFLSSCIALLSSFVWLSLLPSVAISCVAFVSWSFFMYIFRSVFPSCFLSWVVSICMCCRHSVLS